MDPELDPMAAGGLLERIVTWAGQEVGTGNGYICLIEPDTGEMVLRLGTGAYAGLVGLRMLKGEGLSGRVWETGAPVAIPDYSRWEGRVRQVATDAFRAVLGVPLVSGGTVYGVIGLAFSEPGRTFTDDEVTQVSRFAEVVSIALDNARLYAAAQQELVERQKAEGRFRTLVEEIPAIVYSEEFEVGGARQYINRQVEVLFGFTAEEASRANFWKIVRPSRRPGGGPGRGGPLRADRRGRSGWSTASSPSRARSSGSGTSACWSTTRPARRCSGRA